MSTPTAMTMPMTASPRKGSWAVRAAFSLGFFATFVFGFMAGDVAHPSAVFYESRARQLMRVCEALANERDAVVAKYEKLYRATKGGLREETNY